MYIYIKYIRKLISLRIILFFKRIIIILKLIRRDILKLHVSYLRLKVYRKERYLKYLENKNL